MTDDRTPRAMLMHAANGCPHCAKDLDAAGNDAVKQAAEIRMGRATLSMADEARVLKRRGGEHFGRT
jgi:hypothetical protein